MSAGLAQESALAAPSRDPVEQLFRDHLCGVMSFLVRRVRCPVAAEDLCSERRTKFYCGQRRVRCPVAAEDLAQETCVRVL